MKDFILEMGKDFLFIDEEHPIKVGGKTYKIDLLFYHRQLQCMVAFELKTTEFHPSYQGQLEFHLEALDQKSADLMRTQPLALSCAKNLIWKLSDLLSIAA